MNIRNCRLRAGLTQKELAEKSGVTAHSICLWENDLFEPRISSLAMLAEALGVTLDEIMREEAPLKFSRKRLFDLLDEEGVYNVLRATGMPLSMADSWQKGAEPEIRTLRKLANHFNIPIAWFYVKERQTNDQRDSV